VGIARFFQEIANGKRLDPLIIEIMALVLVSTWLIKIFSRKSMVKDTVRRIIRTPKGVRMLHGDYVVYEFALKSKAVIERFSDGIVLADIFDLRPLIDRISDALMLIMANAKDDDELPFFWDGSSIKWK
jgi:hypothetical protein